MIQKLKMINNLINIKIIKAYKMIYLFKMNNKISNTIIIKKYIKNSLKSKVYK